jgi:competence protein ComEC
MGDPTPRRRGIKRPGFAGRLGSRFAALDGLAAGLACAPLAPSLPAPLSAAAFGAVLAGALAVARPRLDAGMGALPWLGLLFAACGLIGIGIGSERLAAIDAGAIRLAPGREVTVRGYVAAVPDRGGGEVAVRLQTPHGRLLVEAREPVPELPVGSLVGVRGRAREADEWEAARLERLGIATIVAARTVERLGSARRGGVDGLLDGLRSRAEDALGRGTSAPAASLLRGFVLGQDDRIAPPIVDQFKRSGLAHLLAVSGQNIVLLSVLATVVLATLGVPLRARLAWVLAAIVLYVPVAGAGPSIQRAGVMGAAGVIAALAGRPRSRWYALLLAAAATLALDPRATGDVGWQLSFAAVVGILLAARPISDAISERRVGWRRGLADGVALTIAATLATAPLMAHYFGAVSIVALPANLVALPAVAPVMWLGMLAAAVGQLPWIPVEPLTWLAGLLASYIAQVAQWFGDPGWSQADLRLGAPVPLTASYAVLATAAMLALRWLGRRRALDPRPRPDRRRLALAVGALATVAAGWLLIPGIGGGSLPGLRLTMLDVGQGDSILLEPRGRDPILIDAGPAAAEVADELADRGIDRLAALAITHPEADHDGGAAAVLERLRPARLLFARAAPATLAAARVAGAAPVRLAAGTVLRSGPLRLEVLWPPQERVVSGPAGRPTDPNLLSLVIVVRWHGFRALLSGDAEAEAAPIATEPIDVLKLAHHGSEDLGLGGLLEQAEPELAVISVGEENPYGHPSPQVLETLESEGVEVLRTDHEGAVSISVTRRHWSVSG